MIKFLYYSNRGWYPSLFENGSGSSYSKNNGAGYGDGIVADTKGRITASGHLSSIEHYPHNLIYYWKI